MKLVGLLLVLLIASVAVAQEHPLLEGVFIQRGLVRSWGDEEWQSEMSYLKEAGMSVIILQGTAFGSSNGPTMTVYPTEIPGFEMMANSVDIVDALLRNAEVMEFKVFLGLNFDNAWWHMFANDREWLFDQVEQGQRVAEELHGRYKARYPNSFYGWYWVPEVENLNFKRLEQQALLAEALSAQLDHLTDLDPSIPVMLSPFMNYQVSTVAEYREMWINVFSQTSFRDGDIFAPQDCVGAGGATLENVEEWIAALREAADTKPELEFWVNIESFDQSDWTARPIGHVVAQMQIAAPYAERLINFAYPHYQSPNVIDSRFHETYLEYVGTGTVDAQPPSAPANLRATLTEEGKVVLQWDPSEDNIGVAGYEIFRRDRFLAKNQVPRSGRSLPFGSLETFVDDLSIRRAFNFTYMVRAYDFAGNRSEFSNPVTVVKERE